MVARNCLGRVVSGELLAGTEIPGDGGGGGGGRGEGGGQWQQRTVHVSLICTTDEYFLFSFLFFFFFLAFFVFLLFFSLQALGEERRGKGGGPVVVGGGTGRLCLTHTVTTRMILHSDGQQCEPFQRVINRVGQRHKTVSINHSLSKRKEGEEKKNKTKKEC